MQFTTQKTQRSFRSSFKKHLPTKFRSQSDSTAFDSSISSSDDVLSVESISSMNQKLSKRKKFKSFFSHSRNNTNAMLTNSSSSDHESCASIHSITSQKKTLSKTKMFKSFFSHSKKSAASYSDSYINCDNDSSSVFSSTAHSKSSSKREKFKSFFSHSKFGPVTYSSDPLNTTFETCSSTSSIETQNKLSTIRKKEPSPYLTSTMAQDNASSDSSTVIDEKTVDAETSFQHKPKSTIRENIRTVFGYRQPYTKVYIASPKDTKSTNVTKPENAPILASRPATLDAPYPIRMTERELKISRRKRKLLIGCQWLSSTAAPVVAVIIIASTPLLPLTLPVSVFFSVVLVYMLCKNAKRFWDCWKQSIHRSKFAIKERYADWKALSKNFFGFSPDPVELLHADKNDAKAGKTYPRSPLETPTQYCARNSLPEYDLTFDEWAYSVYSRTVHADCKRIVISAVDVFLTDEQFLKKNRHVSFAEPIISMTVQPAF